MGTSWLVMSLLKSSINGCHSCHLSSTLRVMHWVTLAPDLPILPHYSFRGIGITSFLVYICFRQGPKLKIFLPGSGDMRCLRG